ncbi:NADP(H)-dependent aldo-keto reductase [Kordiimonas pumila]|uniref:NADP(H)-dependent aldo-keto reductase n=1 Tax=Kordiimonas pumila TaxID=2161677 RepID=A0ABV7D1A2_9PROT|nr:NADP(H)-dependent aldo-keto reductase [Kordiimonas pumila]
MEKRELGRTGIFVSKICLGSMTWGKQNTEEEGHAQIDLALDAGVNFIDTAEMYAVPPTQETYGKTEEIIGSWLAKSGKRSDVIIASKIAGPRTDIDYIRPHLQNDGKSDLDYQSVIEACDASLKRLKTDYIDLYQLHWPSRPVNMFGVLRYPAERGIKAKENKSDIPLSETLGAMADLVKAGKIRAVGVSNETPWGVMHALSLAEKEGLPRVASIQNPYNFLNRSFEIGLAEIAVHEQVGLLAYSPIAGGILSGKYAGGAQPEGARFTLYGKTFNRFLKPLGLAAMEKYVALARKHGLDPAQMANAFVNQQAFLTSNIIGATSLEQLKSNLDSHHITLSQEILAEIDAIETEFPVPCP